MNVLAFDTCFGACSAAVRLAAGTNAARQVARLELRERGHAEALVPMIRAVMAEAGIGFEHLDRIAVTSGPGTFTGTRTGVAAARGLALAARLPLIGVSSLTVMAAGAVRQLAGHELCEEVAVAVDARRGQVYVQLFARADLAPRTGPLLLSYERAAALGENPALLLVGSGAERVAAEARRLGRSAQPRLPGLQPDAADLAEMACALAPAAEPLRPLYLREPDVTLPSAARVDGA
jgi:tRNA threonylcarbamoyladenosine biosynthesis protein TsaB